MRGTFVGVGEMTKKPAVRAPTFRTTFDSLAEVMDERAWDTKSIATVGESRPMGTRVRLGCLCLTGPVRSSALAVGLRWGVSPI